MLALSVFEGEVEERLPILNEVHLPALSGDMLLEVVKRNELHQSSIDALEIALGFSPKYAHAQSKPRPGETTQRIPKLPSLPLLVVGC